MKTPGASGLSPQRTSRHAGSDPSAARTRRRTSSPSSPGTTTVRSRAGSPGCSALWWGHRHRPSMLVLSVGACFVLLAEALVGVAFAEKMKWHSAWWEWHALIVVAYLILSINTYLETQAFGVFTLGYGRLGPTEARLLLIGVNTALALGAATFGLLDILGIGLAGVMIAALVGRAARNLKRLAELEPA